MTEEQLDEILPKNAGIKEEIKKTLIPIKDANTEAGKTTNILDDIKAGAKIINEASDIFNDS